MHNIKLIASLLLLAGLQGCAHSDPWTTRDTVMQTGVTLALALDAVTTADIQNHPNVYEGGGAQRFLGSNPSTRDTYLYFTTLAFTSYFIARALPAKWRPWYQGIYAFDHFRAFANNCQIGLTPCRKGDQSNFSNDFGDRP